MNPDEVIRHYADGDDVPMVVSVTEITSPAGVRTRVGMLLVDYSSAQDKIREVYATLVEDLFKGKDFDEGFDIINKGTELYVATRKMFQVAIFGGGNEHYANGPVYFATFPAEPHFIRAFLEESQKLGNWILHLKTTKHSYLFMVDTPTGMVMSKFKHEPMKLEFVTEFPSP